MKTPSPTGEGFRLFVRYNIINNAGATIANGCPSIGMT